MNTPRHFILSTPLKQKSNSTTDAPTYQLIKHVIRCHLSHKQRSATNDEKEMRSDSSDSNLTQITTNNDAVGVKEDESEQNNLRKKLKLLIEEERNAKACVKTAQLAAEEQSTRLESLVKEFEDQLAKLSKNHDDIVSWKKQQVQKQSELNLSDVDTVDDSAQFSMSSLDDEEENGENKVPVTTIKELIIKNKEEDELLKKEQKELVSKAKMEKELLEEMERGWKKEDEDRIKAWKVESDAMNEKEQKIVDEIKSIKEQEENKNDLMHSTFKNGRKKRKIEELIEEKRGDSTKIDLSFNKDADAKSNTDLPQQKKQKSSSPNNATIKSEDDNSRIGAEAGEKKKKKNQLESELKMEGLKQKEKEIDSLNSKKNQITWLLKQVILAEKRRKLRDKKKGKANNAEGGEGNKVA